jgi:hypothetical protein
MINRKTILSELAMYPEYISSNLDEYLDKDLYAIWGSHCQKYSEEVSAKDLVDNYSNIDFLISSPDGFLEVGDFWIKSNKNIISIKTANSKKAVVSTDHLFETSIGWVHAGKLKKGDLLLTDDGHSQVTGIKLWASTEDVYDWEILHENHRYWAGDGLSSHNTGKTFLLMNAIKQAQDLGYSIVFYDSENAVDKDLVEKFGIDPKKFRYEPCNTVQEFRSSVTALTDTLIAQKTKGVELPKIMLCLDSAGNLATQKEVDDAKSGSDKADMTRAKLLKSTFRILMTKLGICKIPFLFTNHTYQCVWGDANVIMHDDSIKNIKDIIVGDHVKTLDGSKEVQLLTEFKKSYVLEFELENGTIFRCTPEHRFLIKPDWSSESSWKTAEDLNEEDIILQY